MKLVILDPGYAHAHAHHQTVDSGIGRSCSAHGAQTLVLASVDIQSDALLSCAEHLTVLPYFVTPGYPAQAEALPRHQHEVLSRNFAAEIMALYTKGILDGSENLLLHTGYSFHYAGLARAIWHVGERIRGRLLVSTMFHPGARICDRETGEVEYLDLREYLRHKQALELLQVASAHAGLKTMLAAPCRAYARIYQTLWSSGVVEVHPAVCHTPLPRPAPEETGAPPQVLLYLGGPKHDKGLPFAAALGAAAALALPKVRFLFHFNDAFSGAAAFEADIAALRQAGSRHGNVTILTGNLTPETYNTIIAQSQIVCVLYDPASYRFKTSGVFWDALRAPGLQWLVTAGTWPQAELDEIGLPHAVVDHGDVDGGVERLAGLLRDTRSNGRVPPGVDTTYLGLLNSSFGDWVRRRLEGQNFGLRDGQAVMTSPDYQPDRGRILVVRTHYGHFSPLSGPGGFIPHLRGLGYAVDEWLVPLGEGKLESAPAETRDALLGVARRSLRSYQGNAIPVETSLQEVWHRYDVIHFLDAEHCGLLSALLHRRRPDPNGPRLVATFHQPGSIMRDLLGDPGFLRGFDAIQLMSPCQVDFFGPLVDRDRLHQVPHGLAPELMEDHLPLGLPGIDPDEHLPGYDELARDKTVLLTVGNWLRDYPALLETARLLRDERDLLFVVVSKGLSLDTGGAGNVALYNAGLTDSQLHGLYKRATLLFLPLSDGAANNAVLEAMAHGLPIVTTDLPSTRFYTDGQAVFATDPKSYAAALRRTVAQLRTPGQRDRLARALRDRASGLTWKNVARMLHETIYAPLLPHEPRERS